MKSKHIKKETAKRLREGYHTYLMEAIEESIDLYTEETFSRGHDSFFADASVHAYRIAEKIFKEYTNQKDGKYKDPKDLAKVIEEYFNSLKTE